MAKKKSRQTKRSLRSESMRSESTEPDSEGAPNASDGETSEGQSASVVAPLRLPTMDRNRWLMLLFSGSCYALALPPFQLWPLAFVATAGWILLAQQSPAKREWRWIWLVGFLHWAMTFHFLRLPHWAGILGLLMIASYSALYDVAFVFMTRRLQQRGWPVLLAAPIIWGGLEVLRSTLFTGIPIGILAHALYRQPLLIQTADIAGEITVSVLLVGLSSVLAVLIQRIALRPDRSSGRSALVASLVGVNIIALMLIYGWQTTQQYQLPKVDAQASSTIALIQGARDVQFGQTEAELTKESRQSYQTHCNLTIQARKAADQLSAVVWPESMFPALDVLPIDDRVYQLDQGELEKRKLPVADLLERQQLLPFQVLYSTGTGGAPTDMYRTSVPLIVGMGSYDVYADRDYNSAVMFDSFGNVTGRYGKSHLVPFGEFLPLGDVFPQLYELAPITRGLSRGSGVEKFEVAQRVLVPTICYESVIGWHVRNYMNDIDWEGQAGQSELGSSATEEMEDVSASGFDALLNISNDGWFWGSSALDLHLASNVFRAVENRCQHLVASNTGISGEIAPDGTILQEGDKRTNEFFLVKVPKRPQEWQPLWWRIGNIPWWACSLIVVAGCLWPLSSERRKKHRLSNESHFD